MLQFELGDHNDRACAISCVQRVFVLHFVVAKLITFHMQGSSLYILDHPDHSQNFLTIENITSKVVTIYIMPILSTMVSKAQLPSQDRDKNVRDRPIIDIDSSATKEKPQKDYEEL